MRSSPRFARSFASTFLGIGLALSVASCREPPARSKRGPVAAQSAAAAHLERPQFVAATLQGGPVEPFVQEQVERAEAEHARVLVYVGAAWCEPCRHFHEAVKRGDLDGVLGNTRLLEFDADHDSAALKNAGYRFQLIPVLALPGPDGRGTGPMITGSVKGPNAVRDDLAPRLTALLAGRYID